MHFCFSKDGAVLRLATQKTSLPLLLLSRYAVSRFGSLFIDDTIYTGSLESNLLQMVIAKEKINLFMKGQDTDLDLIYDKFGIDYNLLALLLHRRVDEEGNFQIRWGDQQIA